MLRTAEDVALLLPVKFVPVEVQGVYYLTDTNALLLAEFFQGSPESVHYDLAAIMRSASRVGASRLVFVHNHLAGGISLSSEDLNTARAIRSKLSSRGIRLYGFCVTDGSYVTSAPL